MGSWRWRVLLLLWIAQLRMGERLFRKVIPVAPLGPPKLSYSTPILFVGSCFSSNVHRRLERLKLPSFGNPFGVLYTPSVMKRSLRRLVQGYRYTEEDLIMHPKGYYASLDHHSSYVGDDLPQVLANLNRRTDQARSSLRGGEHAHVFITFGSAFGFCATDGLLRMGSTLTPGEMVANCHKLPQGLFRRRLESAAEVCEDILQMVEHLRSWREEVGITLTVSPVRHWKDGPVENARSKAHLLTGVHAAIDQDPSLSYFPSYEIVLDELRDYRFFEADMLHPNDVAIDYVTDRLLESYFDISAIQATVDRVEALQKAVDHRPFRPESPEHQAFLQRQLKDARELQEQLPYADFNPEIGQLEAQVKQ